MAPDYGSNGYILQELQSVPGAGYVLLITAVTAIKFYRGPAPGYRRLLNGHVTPPGDLTPGQTWWQRLLPEICTKRADPVSSMMKQHVSSMCYRAVDMVNGGMTQIANQLKIGTRTLKR